MKQADFRAGPGYSRGVGRESETAGIGPATQYPERRPTREYRASASAARGGRLARSGGIFRDVHRAQNLRHARIPDHRCDAFVAVLALRVAIDELVGMAARSEEHTSELQSLMRISYAVFCLKKKNTR